MKVNFHPLFQSDLESAALHYLKEADREIADQFIDEVEQTLFRITANPLKCSVAFKNVRRMRLKKFKAYAVRYSYDEFADVLFVGSLVHGARDPKTDQDRFD